MYYISSSFSDKPSAPEDFVGTGYTETTISLKWSPPKDDGGSPVTGYYVEKRESGKTEWSYETETSVDEQEMTSRNLTERKSYYFRVCAVNSVGKGEFNELAEPIMAKCPHGELI